MMMYGKKLKAGYYSKMAKKRKAKVKSVVKRIKSRKSAVVGGIKISPNIP